MNQILQGIIPALLTPFGKDGKVNTDALAQLIDWNIEKGVNGFYVGGSTAEAFLLTEEERNFVYFNRSGDPLCESGGEMGLYRNFRYCAVLL